MVAAAVASRQTADECEMSSHCMSMIAETDISSRHVRTPSFCSLCTVAAGAIEFSAMMDRVTSTCPSRTYTAGVQS